MQTVGVRRENPSADGRVDVGCATGPVLERVAVRGSGVVEGPRVVDGERGSVCGHG